MSTQEIATHSHLTTFEVEALSQQTSWDGVAIDKVRVFTRACNVDFDNPEQMRRIEDYLSKRPTFRYLRLSPDWKTYYLPMLIRWRQSYGIAITKDTPLWPPIRELMIRLNPLMK